MLTDAERLARGLGQLPPPSARPALVIISGLPGSGKSFCCRKLAQRLPSVTLKSDALRRILFKTPVYGFAESALLFGAIRLLGERLLGLGISVILDATNLAERHRAIFCRLGERLGAKVVVVRVKAPEALVKMRLEKRLREPAGDSGAGWDVYLKMKPSVERIARRHIVIDTSQDINPALDRIIAEINR